jgi:large subunit ribosomal protein L7/L12
LAEEKKASEKIEKLTEEISKLSVLELSELVNILQDKLGVSAMPVSQAPAATAQESEEATSDEGGNKTVVMTASGDQKIAVIKALREINPNLGLKEAKDITEAVPAEIVKDAKAEEAAEAKKKLEEAGATVELK